jgi:hypothetical protein
MPLRLHDPAHRHAEIGGGFDDTVQQVQLQQVRRGDDADQPVRFDDGQMVDVAKGGGVYIFYPSTCTASVLCRTANKIARSETTR